jgi:hypothetical protein
MSAPDRISDWYRGRRSPRSRDRQQLTDLRLALTKQRRQNTAETLGSAREFASLS